MTDKFELTKITGSRQALPSLTSKPIYDAGENSPTEDWKLVVILFYSPPC